MDARAGTPLTLLYNRDPSAAAAAAENPSTGSGGLATAGAPPSISLARSLFMPLRRMTTATGGVAPAQYRAAAAPSKLPNAVRPKKGKTSAKKNKAADGSGSSKARGKKLAGRLTGAAATKAPASSLVEPASDAHHVFDEMPPSLNDDAYMSTMGVGSNNSHWSQTNDIHFEDHEFEVDEEGEGIVDAPEGREGNYTSKDDILLCNTWLQVSRDPSIYNITQNLFKEEERKTKKGKIKKGRIFTLPHCYEVLKDDEKWKKREDLDDLHLSNKSKRTIELNDDDEEEEEDASSDDNKRSPTPNSVSYSKPKRPDGCKKDKTEKKKRKGDDELKNAMEAIVKAIKEAKELLPPRHPRATYRSGMALRGGGSPCYLYSPANRA
ncbi:Alternative oxidase 1a, mitochondrial [Hordeum vulgare]|nr:Alternative oxidase 1a, mitochondrial [Hordeum vulgare]